MEWAWWVVIALAALAGELATLGLFLACFAVAGFLTAALSFLIPLAAQIGLFAIVSLLLLLVVRPVALRVLPVSTQPGGGPELGPSDDVGTVTERVERGRGQIRVGAGEFWSARPIAPDLVLLPGQDAEIVGMDGLTALVRPVGGRPELTVASAEDAFGLSPRELEVVRYICEGLTNAEIAERLVVSPRTVHHHVSHILAKMNADNRAEVVRLAMERHLVQAASPEDD
jgi:membrane protein implicated in regulation of membrane protease activity/DNA-binding CsgD family transcriptional regulator